MKFLFAYLLPILIMAMILYEFYTYGFTVNASVNKFLIGAVYGILMFIAIFFIKAITMTVSNWMKH